MAGIAAAVADNGKGTAGVAFQTLLVVEKVSIPALNPGIELALTNSLAAEGIEDAVRRNVSTTTSPHSWRGSGITEYLRNGGTLETAQEIAAHESSRTTKLYDRSQGEITLDEIERIPAV